MEIKSPPVLRGKVAREFYERWKSFKDPTSKKEAQESFRQTKAFLAKYYNPFRDVKIEE